MRHAFVAIVVQNVSSNEVVALTMELSTSTKKAPLYEVLVWMILELCGLVFDCNGFFPSVNYCSVLPQNGGTLLFE